MALLRFLQGSLAIVAALIAVAPAYAAVSTSESTSYQLINPDYVTDSPLESPTYQLQGGLTWHADAMEGVHFTLIPGPVPGSSSSSSSPTTGSAGGAPSASHGGHHGAGGPPGAQSSSVSSVYSRPPRVKPRPVAVPEIVSAPASFAPAESYHAGARGEQAPSVSGGLQFMGTPPCALLAHVHPAAGWPLPNRPRALTGLWLLSMIAGIACLLLLAAVRPTSMRPDAGHVRKTGRRRSVRLR